MMKTAILAAGCAVMLLGCGSKNDQPELGDQLFSTLKGQLAQRRAKGQPQAAAQVTRAQVDQSTIPLVRVTVGLTNSQATAGDFAQNGDTSTYLMGTGQALYLRGGLLTGTRGLGYDLMSLDIPFRSARALLGEGEYARVHRYLNSENRLIKQVFVCTASIGAPGKLVQLERAYTVRRITETCSGETHSFQNTYDMDRSGQVWRSRQWVEPTAGYMLIEQLKA